MSSLADLNAAVKRSPLPTDKFSIDEAGSKGEIYLAIECIEKLSKLVEDGIDEEGLRRDNERLRKQNEELRKRMKEILLADYEPSHQFDHEKLIEIADQYINFSTE